MYPNGSHLSFKCEKKMNTLYSSLYIKVILFFIIVFFQLGCSMHHQIKTPSKPVIHDHAKEFVIFWKNIENLHLDLQREKLKTDFFPKFSQFYQYKIDKWENTGKNPDQELNKYLSEFPKIKNLFTQKSNEISNQIDIALKSFITYFPDLNKNFEIFITHSLGELDGGIRKIENETYFILGIDNMVHFHNNFSTEIPFFHHELFHLYHAPYSSDEKVIWSSLWSEGLATYVSEVLNPKSTSAELLLDIPSSMVDKINSDITYHWQDLKSKLNSNKNEDYITYFLLSSKNEQIVQRAGYYLGYLLAKNIGKTYSLQEMAQLKPKQVHSLLKVHINKMLE